MLLMARNEWRGIEAFSLFALFGLWQAVTAEDLVYQPVDFSTFHNRNMKADVNRIGVEATPPTGDVILGGVPFSIPTAGRNVWNSYFDVRPNPRGIEIAVRVRAAVEVHTLINSDWGLPGPQSYAHLEFVGSAGAVFRKVLIGGADIRDFFSGGHTNTINGTTTRMAWSNNVDKKLDKQRIELPSEFRDQELTVIRLVDNGFDPETRSEIAWQRVWLAGVTVGALSEPPDLPFRRGDTNVDGRFDISDPIFIIGCLFLGSACGACGDSIDANDDGLINIADPTYLLNWLFLEGTSPPPPFPGCGIDSTSDELAGCDAFDLCG